jgi:hypothetical protein
MTAKKFRIMGKELNISEIAKLPQPDIERFIIEHEEELSIFEIFQLRENFPIEVIEASKFLKKRIDELHGNGDDDKQ